MTDQGPRTDQEPSTKNTGPRVALTVDFLFDAVLFELLVEIAARRVDDLGGLRDVPGVLSQLLHEISPFGCVLERAQCGGAGRLRLVAFRSGPLGSGGSGRPICLTVAQIAGQVVGA